MEESREARPTLSLPSPVNEESNETQAEMA